MGAITGTYLSTSAKGIREDLSDLIYDISPLETPVISNIAKIKATNTLHEWQIDALNNADDTARAEGDDVSTFDTTNPTTRAGNYTQILRRTGIISGTLEAVKKAGRNSEEAYQKARRLKELKRDIEKMVCDNVAKASGGTRTSAGIPSWIATNTNKGTGAAADPTGDGSNARTDGTTRAFTETSLKSVLQAIYTQGGDPDLVVTGPAMRQVFSGFSGGATRFDRSEDKKLYATVDVYVSDFGELSVTASRFSRATDVLILDTDYWKLAELRAAAAEPLAKTGDAEKFMVIWEGTLESCQQKASGIVADVA